MEKMPESIEKIKSLFDKISPLFDTWLEVLQGRIYGYVSWEHLRRYLPEDKDSLILDAGGGTGRWSLPLAKMGYRVVLCDISEGMLKQAEKNIYKEKLSEKIKIKKEDLTNLSFQDETFDFVLCEDGPISISDSKQVVKELARVLKKERKIWAAVIGRYPFVLNKTETNPQEALELLKSETAYAPYKGIKKTRLFYPAEIQSLFKQSNIEVIKIYGNRIMIRLLSEKIQNMTNYDDELFSALAEIELHLSTQPSLLGIAEYLQVVGEKC